MFDSVEVEVLDFLELKDFRMNYKGTHYMKMFLMDEKIYPPFPVTKLYKELAVKNKDTASRVERALRYSVLNSGYAGLTVGEALAIIKKDYCKYRLEAGK